MKILLTGANGFLGSALASFWSQKGYEVHALVRPTSDLRRLERILPLIKIHTIETDREIDEVVRLNLPDVLVHTACCYGRKDESLLRIQDSNVRLGLSLLHAIVAHCSQQVIVLNTDTVLDASVSDYALTKKHFRELAHVMEKKWPDFLKIIDLRLQNMYGAGDDSTKFTSTVLQSCIDQAPSLALTAGLQRRDFIYIDDVVQAYDAILRNAQFLPPATHLDIGSGEAITVKLFAEAVREAAASGTILRFGALQARLNEPDLCVANTEMLMALGWRPQYSLRAGIEKMVQHERILLTSR